MSEAGWSPIVWGRTLEADHWWRALPGGVTAAQMRVLIENAALGGVELDEPRYLLARRFGRWFVGVACSAGDLSDSMTEDRKGRELNTFVGWAAPVGGGPPPPLPELAANYAGWAGPVYREWMGQDWDRPSAELRGPHRTAAGPAPWEQPPGSSMATVGRDPGQLRTRPGVVVLYPAAEQVRTWSAGLHSIDPFVLVVGWPRRRNMPLRHLTHACVEEVADAVEVQVENGLDLEAERVELLEAADASAAEPNESRPGPPPRRASWAFWQRSREIEQLTAELAEVSDRLTAAEQDIAKLMEAVADRREPPPAVE